MSKHKKHLITSLYAVLVSIFLFLEVVFRISIIGFFRFQNLFRVFLFVNAYALIVVFLIRLLPRKSIKYVALMLVVLITGFYFSQDIYYRILSGFFSLSLISDAGAAITFLGDALRNVSWLHALYLLPVSFGIYLFVKQKHKKTSKTSLFFSSKKDFIYSFLITFSFFTLTVATIPKINVKLTDSPFAYSDYDLYIENPNPYQTINKFGVLSYLHRDIAVSIKVVNDIDASKKEVADYLDSRLKHENNEYTDYFKGKNLIVIMAESLDTYGIDPSLTPHIYQMQQSSWNFTNYYSPLYNRNTADTEFMSQTGLYAHKNVRLSMEAFIGNTFPNALPKLFKAGGLETYSFHNYVDYFYPRSEFHMNTLGYDAYFGAKELGILEEKEIISGTHQWPSDLDLINQAIDILSEKEEPFFSNVITVSGHMPYSEKHPIAKKNIDLIRQIFIDEERDIPTDELLYYHAANYELDLAIGALLERLEQENLAKDTVVMLYGDHYAYGLDKAVIGHYDPTKDASDFLGMQKVPMMIYHPDLTFENKNEIFASIDITPTLANLFGLNLDYSQILGKDIFSNQLKSILFASGSVLTDQFRYNFEKDEIILFSEITEEDAILIVNEHIYIRKINQLILELDYFNEIEIDE